MMSQLMHGWQAQRKFEYKKRKYEYKKRKLEILFSNPDISHEKDVYLRER